MKTIGGVVCQTELPGSFPDRQIQFKELDRQQQGGEGNLGPFENTAFPNAPLSPTAIAFVPLTSYPTKTSAVAVRARRVRNQETVIPKIGFSGLFIMGYIDLSR